MLQLLQTVGKYINDTQKITCEVKSIYQEENKKQIISVTEKQSIQSTKQQQATTSYNHHN
jgi:hypothetical protein